MKKIIALLLSVLMIFSMAAVAEEARDTALVGFLSNIVLETGSEDETNRIALDGLEVYSSIDTADGLGWVIQAFNGDDSLLLAELKLENAQLKFAIDGVDTTFVEDIPALAGQDAAALRDAIRPLLPALLNAKLPPISIGGLPKLDVTSLVGAFGTVAEDGSATFSIPHEAVDSLLDQVLELGQTVGDSVPGLDQALELLKQLRDNGMSVAFEGTILDDGVTQTTSVEIYPVSGGRAAESAAAIVNFATAQDVISVTVDQPGDISARTIADLEIMTDAASNAASVTLDIAGVVQVALGIYREDGLQNIGLSMDSGFGGSFNTALIYGTSGDVDVLDLSLTAGEDTAFELISNSSAVSDDATEGTLEVAAVSQGSKFRLTADVQEFLGSLDLGGFTMPGNTASFDELSGEAYSEALQGALEPLITYFGQAFTKIAA